MHAKSIVLLSETGLLLRVSFHAYDVHKVGKTQLRHGSRVYSGVVVTLAEPTLDEEAEPNLIALSCSLLSFRLWARNTTRGSADFNSRERETSLNRVTTSYTSRWAST